MTEPRDPDSRSHKLSTEPASHVESVAGRTDSPTVMTQEQLAEAKSYGREGLWCELADKGLDITYLAVMAFFLARPLDVWLREDLSLENSWLRLAAMLVIVTVIHIAVSLPLSFFSGHVLEHKYSLSNQTYQQWLWRYLKIQLLAMVLGLVMFEGLYGLIYVTGPWWWLAAAACFFLVSIVLGRLWPVLIMPLFYKIDRLEDPTLMDRFGELCEGTGLSIEGVYRMELSAETVKANAMLAGFGKTKRVILGDTLLDKFTPDEIAVVFAHEVGHHVHRHIRKLILIGATTSIVAFLVCHWMIAAWDGHSEWYDRFPVYALPMFMLIITLLSLFSEPLQNGISRFFERQSDRYALRATGMRDAYKSAFSKLAKLNKDDPDPHPLEVFLLHSHPSIDERLALADERT